jgi:hypothetical protein
MELKGKKFCTLALRTVKITIMTSIRKFSSTIIERIVRIMTKGDLKLMMKGILCAFTLSMNVRRL